MIIYIEDNINNQRLVQRMLSKRNLEVEIYADPESGYEAVLEKKPQLILLDIHLKARITGVDVLRRIRAEGIDTPIVVLTAFQMLADRQHALEAGANDFLPKPFTIQQFLTVVDKYV
jgi:DNA-binding response OmpR family regulator